MHVKQALQTLQEGEPVVVDGKTIQPEQVERVSLDTGEEVFWVRTEGNLWLAIDTTSEELFFFQDLDEEFDSSEDTILFRGTDYEFSDEASGTLYDEDGDEVDQVEFRDFESEKEVIRIVQYEVTGDAVASLGHRVTEEDLQEA